MTPDDARQFFFQHLPHVRDTSDLLRLTFWVLPHLPANPDRPLGAMETMIFRLQMEHSKYDNSIRIWHSSNRDVSTQLRSLEPIYARGSSGPSFCSSLSPPLRLPNGPNVDGPGLTLGVFAKEHQAAKKKLDTATSVEQWWTLFLGYTPLWMRTAYHWDKPTPEQKIVLNSAKKTMLDYVPGMAGRTQLGYNNRSGTTHIRFNSSFSNAILKDAPHWNALVAGQQFLSIKDIKENTLLIDGFQSTMPGVHNEIRTLCQAMCLVYDWNEMSDPQVRRALENAKEQTKSNATSLPLPDEALTP